MTNVSSAKANNPGKTKEFSQKAKKALFADGYLKLNYFTLFWIFVAGSIFGLVVETIYHAIVFGGLESRAGLVWGPFSPIYGVGAVLLTLSLNWFYHSHNLVIFLISMAVGSVIEFGTSWGMEFFWGAVAWNYDGTFGSIAGRTNFFFGVMWGLLGLVWVRFLNPLIKLAFSHVNRKNLVVKIVTVLMSIFIALNCAVTFLAVERQSQRKAEIPATTPIQQFCDTYFPDSYLEDRFQNMTVNAKN